MVRCPRNNRIGKHMPPQARDFAEFALSGLTRLLPHTEVEEISMGKPATAAVRWLGSSRKRLTVVASLPFAGYDCAASMIVKRRHVLAAESSGLRTVDLHERDICRALVEELAESISAVTDLNSLKHVRGGFDQRVVARHLASSLDLALDVNGLIEAIKRLGVETYENKALTFACVVDGDRVDEPNDHAVFPADYLARKKYKVLSDGYHTAYLVSSRGAVLDLIEISTLKKRPPVKSFWPTWARSIAATCTGARVGFCLTRHGDMMAFYGGSIRLTCRSGRWQYWNHAHLIDLLARRARVQRVPKRVIPAVLNLLYRTALDVSFRRSGGLFVLLRNRANIKCLVRPADTMHSRHRSLLDRSFDDAVGSTNHNRIPIQVAVELAALDGAIVADNQGRIMAHGAVLEPRRKGKSAGAEGSRTKAAIGASHYGLSVKISSDGGITVYAAGKEFVAI